MKRTIFICGISLLACVSMAQTLKVKVSNPSKTERKDAPVVLSLSEYGKVKSALVTLNGVEVPCQLDDLNGDHVMDELCFLANLNKKEKQEYVVTLSKTGSPRTYQERTFAELMLRNSKVSIKNKHDIYLHELTVERGVNPYSIVHHHGVAFESELIAMRIYFDHRQTVDLYGKKRKALEIKDTQFYPDEKQLAEGYGDDVLWCGSSFGLGALRGWDGKNQTMLEDVEGRTQRVVSKGPLRAIVELVDDQWVPQPGMEPVDMTTRYTLYAGHRDCSVDIFFDRPVPNYLFATGLVNVQGSTEYSDHQGLRGCWGTAWAVSGKDTLTHQRETVGLGIRIPKKHLVNEQPANDVDYGYIVKTPTDALHYDIVYCSDKESFGYHSSKDWFDYLQIWKKEIDSPIVVTISKMD
ncbi:MAG: DUF4861 domain-containing protein [Prevotella sp.]|nr:DUF4861 domain-containing protein [Prevotella sp.]